MKASSPREREREIYIDRKRERDRQTGGARGEQQGFRQAGEEPNPNIPNNAGKIFRALVSAKPSSLMRLADLDEYRSFTERYSSQTKNNCSAEMWSGSEEGSYLRLIDCGITQL